jgi:hypothetical protein
MSSRSTSTKREREVVGGHSLPRSPRDQNHDLRFENRGERDLEGIGTRQLSAVV